MPERRYPCWYSGGVAEIEELSMEELAGDTGETGVGGAARGGLNESNDVSESRESARHRRHRIRRRVREAVLLIMAVILSAIILLGVFLAERWKGKPA